MKIIDALTAPAMGGGHILLAVSVCLSVDHIWSSSLKLLHCLLHFEGTCTQVVRTQKSSCFKVLWQRSLLLKIDNHHDHSTRPTFHLILMKLYTNLLQSGHHGKGNILGFFAHGKGHCYYKYRNAGVKFIGQHMGQGIYIVRTVSSQFIIQIWLGRHKLFFENNFVLYLLINQIYI